MSELCTREGTLYDSRDSMITGVRGAIRLQYISPIKTQVMNSDLSRELIGHSM